MDRDMAMELSTSVMWKGVCEELDTKIRAKLNQLKFCNKEELEGLQLEIRTLEEVKNLPKDVVDREE